MLAQYAAHVEPLFDVGPENFRPAAKSDVHVRSHHAAAESVAAAIEEKRSVIVLRTAFQQRRKTLRNALQSLDIDWQQVGVDPSIRPDAVDLPGYVEIANRLAGRQISRKGEHE